MLRYQTIPITSFQQNCSIVWCDETNEAALIDPGGDIDQLNAAVDGLKLNLRAIWVTHPHIDHVGGVAELAKQRQLSIIGPNLADDYWIQALPQQSTMFGFPYAAPFRPDRWLQEDDTVELGHCVFEVRHCPGHTPGHVIFFCRAAKRAFVGDVLFAGSIGRTDFPGGSQQALLDSITQKLWPLGDDVVFIPGHGPESTFGAERQHNPFVRGT